MYKDYHQFKPLVESKKAGTPLEQLSYLHENETVFADAKLKVLREMLQPYELKEFQLIAKPSKALQRSIIQQDDPAGPPGTYSKDEIKSFQRGITGSVFLGASAYAIIGAVAIIYPFLGPYPILALMIGSILGRKGFSLMATGGLKEMMRRFFNLLKAAKNSKEWTEEDLKTANKVGDIGWQWYNDMVDSPDKRRLGSSIEKLRRAMQTRDLKKANVAVVEIRTVLKSMSIDIPSGADPYSIEA